MFSLVTVSSAPVLKVDEKFGEMKVQKKYEDNYETWEMKHVN